MPTVTFFYDLGSPFAYITADRIDEQFDTSITVDWVPVLLGGILKSTGRSSWAESAARADGIDEVAQRASTYGMPAFHFPEPWPNNGLTAMRVATWAYSAGAGRRFARAGFEVQFNDGLPLSETENIELAAHRAGLDPQFAIEAAQDQIVKQTLIDNTQAAIDIGAKGVPTIVVGEQAFWGDDKLHEAVAAAAKL